MHRSYYAYHLMRPYPYRWFTPVVAIGGIIGLVLFSLLNVATQGYELNPTASTDPNSTLSERDWLSPLPSFFVGTHSSCEDTLVPLRTQVYTNNTVLPYSIERVWRVQTDGEEENLGSLVYNNQPLQQCNVTNMNIEIDISNRSPSQMAFLPVGGTVVGRVECYFLSSDGRTYVELSGLFDPVPSSTQSNSYQAFVYSNSTNQPNFYWGRSMMRTYWADMMWRFAQSNKDHDNRWINGVVTVDRLPANTTATEDELLNQNFLRIDCFMNQVKEPSTNTFIDYCGGRRNMTTFQDSRLDDLPDLEFWESVNTMSKAMYFVLLADLGRDDSSMPNLLSRPDLLKEFTKNLGQIRTNLSSSFTWGIGSEIASEGFDPSKEQDTDLSVSPSVLSTTYLCKVRKLKNGFSLFIAVLVADIVFMSSLWRGWVWIVDTFWVGEKAILEDTCECYGRARADRESSEEVGEAVPLKPLTSRNRSLDEVRITD